MAISTQQSLQRLIEKRETFGLDENASFIPQSVTRDTQGQSHVRFQQFYRGVRVWGGEVISYTDAAENELPQTAALKHNIQIDVTPTLSASEALAIVKADLASRFEFAHEPIVELVVYPETVKRVLPQRLQIAEAKLNAEDFITEVKGYLLAYYIHTELENLGHTRHTDYSGECKLRRYYREVGQSSYFKCHWFREESV
ncbi:MAG: hypothetical protein ACXW1W_10345 [Methylococcaceae bacterium]